MGDERDTDELVPPVEAWYCTVCGIEAPDFTPTMSKRNSKNPHGRHVGVIAYPCGHEQRGGLGFGIPPSVVRGSRLSNVSLSPIPPQEDDGAQ